MVDSFLFYSNSTSFMLAGFAHAQWQSRSIDLSISSALMVRMFLTNINPLKMEINDFTNDMRFIEIIYQTLILVLCSLAYTIGIYVQLFSKMQVSESSGGVM